MLRKRLDEGELENKPFLAEKRDQNQPIVCIAGRTALFCQDLFTQRGEMPDA